MGKASKAMWDPGLTIDECRKRAVLLQALSWEHMQMLEVNRAMSHEMNERDSLLRDRPLSTTILFTGTSMCFNPTCPTFDVTRLVL